MLSANKSNEQQCNQKKATMNCSRSISIESILLYFFSVHVLLHCSASNTHRHKATAFVKELTSGGSSVKQLSKQIMYFALPNSIQKNGRWISAFAVAYSTRLTKMKRSKTSRFNEERNCFFPIHWPNSKLMFVRFDSDSDTVPLSFLFVFFLPPLLTYCY